jgi:hypothetical protein
MANEINILSKLSVEDREVAADTMGELIAVNVYRELDTARLRAEKASSGCNIIGNCSCSSKERLISQFR